MLKVHEIYQSVQGESTFAGLPCTFIRLTYCNLRCTYCDTEHAFYDGNMMEISEILQQVKKFGNRLVEVTGGEPLVQGTSILLMRNLLDEGFTVLLETSGSLPIRDVDPRVHIIMDLKCPDSGMVNKNLWDNLHYVKHTDEIKFVVASDTDIDWAVSTISANRLDKVCTLLFSPVFGRISPDYIVKRIIEEKIPVRFQLQMHKFIWPADTRGV